MESLLGAAIFCLMVVNAHTQSCGGQDDVMLQKQRIQSIRSNIMAQLGPEYYAYNASRNGTVVDNATIEAFYAINNATMKEIRGRSESQAPRSYFAEKIISFSAVPLQGENAGKRSAPGILAINVLDKFRIQFNFHVDYQLSDITKAELMLFQLPCSVNDTCNQKQYVEIRNVNANDRGTRIIQGVYVKLTDSGYHTFDVMESVGEWIAQQASSPVTLEVISYCFNSLDCNKPVNGTPPTRVHFVDTTCDLKTIPRLNLNAKNPLERSQESNRAKRQTSGVGFCSANQALCCLQPLTVNVKDLNLPFIISPLTIDINYCQGVCPRTPGGNLMTPQIFAQYSQLLSGPAASLTPCCSGNTYHSINALVLNSAGTAEPLTLPNVVVDSCRCA